MAMNLDSRKGFVKVSRFSVLVFVALAGILGMVPPTYLGLMMAEEQTTQDRNKAIDYFQQSLAVFKQIRNTQFEPAILSFIGLNYLLFGDIPNEQEYLLKSVEIAKKIGDKETEVRASDFLKKSQLSSSSTVQNRKSQADYLLRQGAQQFQTSRYRKALQTITSAIEIYRDIKDRYGEAASLLGLGAI
ncbi:hypothetical protein B9G53_23175 [Pseudanabaena sp. SR411]|uniref:hypothetical protein n=1 Tax=Pseudanabaena sp. SR411 TaxID=1980935 RepID=UPI000B99A351|nr:hypothetical protein [Pseudanabaena sp. SR411]OYQ62249.1 hypothetical protein B9G53_23175 [Pseudanabaena sp. SR411]